MATCKVCGHLIMESHKAYGWGGPICNCGFGTPSMTTEDKETIDELDLPPPERPDSE